MDEAISVSYVIDKLPPSWKYFKHTLKHKEEMALVELGSDLHFKESLKSTRYNDNKGKRKYQDNTKSNPSKKSKLTCWKYGKSGHLKRDCKDVKIGNKTNVSGISASGIGSNNHLKGTRDEIYDQHSYCSSVETGPKTFDEAMKSQDVSFWKEAINDEMDSIMGNNTRVLADLLLVDMTKEFLSSRFFIKDMREADVIIMSTPMDTSEKLMRNNVGKLSGYTSNPSTQHWQAIQRASKKQTCITSSTMESKFVALVAADKKLNDSKEINPIRRIHLSGYGVSRAFSDTINSRLKNEFQGAISYSLYSIQLKLNFSSKEEQPRSSTNPNSIEDIVWFMTRSSTKELLSPLENPERVLRSTRKLFDNPSLTELNPPEEDQLFEIEEHIEEEVTKIMAETMEQYMSKTREDYRSGVTRPTINQDTPFELKGQFLKELHDNTFSGSEQEDANEHIEKVLPNAL
ncbi:zinc finger, CCHC-type containing protein [Tanacetum coccineum]